LTVSQGKVAALNRWSGKLIILAYTVGNKCAKNLCKWAVLVQLMIKNVIACFFESESFMTIVVTGFM